MLCYIRCILTPQFLQCNGIHLTGLKLLNYTKKKFLTFESFVELTIITSRPTLVWKVSLLNIRLDSSPVLVREVLQYTRSQYSY